MLEVSGTGITGKKLFTRFISRSSHSRYLRGLFPGDIAFLANWKNLTKFDADNCEEVTGKISSRNHTNSGGDVSDVANCEKARPVFGALKAGIIDNFRIFLWKIIALVNSHKYCTGNIADLANCKSLSVFGAEKTKLTGKNYTTLCSRTSLLTILLCISYRRY